MDRFDVLLVLALIGVNSLFFSLLKVLPDRVFERKGSFILFCLLFVLSIPGNLIYFGVDHIQGNRTADIVDAKMKALKAEHSEEVRELNRKHSEEVSLLRSIIEGYRERNNEP